MPFYEGAHFTNASAIYVSVGLRCSKCGGDDWRISLAQSPHPDLNFTETAALIDALMCMSCYQVIGAAVEPTAPSH